MLSQARPDAQTSNPNRRRLTMDTMESKPQAPDRPDVEPIEVVKNRLVSEIINCNHDKGHALMLVGEIIARYRGMESRIKDLESEIDLMQKQWDRYGGNQPENLYQPPKE